MTAPTTAEDAYWSAHWVARDLLGQLAERIRHLPAPSDIDRPVGWNHVGDVRRVNALLFEAVASLERQPG